MDRENNPRLKYALCGAAFAALLALSWPKAGIAALAWLAPAPFAWAVLKCRNVRQAAMFGLYSGFLLYIFILYWIYPTCRAGGAGVFVSLLAWLLLSLVLGLEWAALAAVMKCYDGYGRFFAPLSAAALVGIEYSKITVCKMFVWFPWFLLGYTQWKFQAIVQSAAWTGPYGAGFVVSFFGFSLGYAAFVRKPAPSSRLRALLPGIALEISAAVVLAAILISLGALRLAHAPRAETYPAAALQPDIAQYQKWDADFARSIIERTTKLCSDARGVSPSPKLIVWPESALPGPLEEEPLRSYAAAMARGTGAWQIIGSEREDGGKNFVSAYLVDPSGNIAGVYDKRQLVPFGEAVPLHDFLGKFIHPLAHLGGFEPGTDRPRLMNAGGYKVGVGICYESIFPYLWRGYGKVDADLLVNITNDGWYLNTAAPYQHLTASVFRAAENGRPLLRAANTGVSALIDGYGRVIASTELDSQTVLAAPVPLAKMRTFYIAHGSIFVQLAYAAAFIGLLAAVIFT